MPRYRFGEFILSPRRRLLIRNGVEQPLIPRYFDLLVFLVERRGEAVHRRDIFDRIWSDAIVSDSALSQAVRTIRRTLDDDSRDPRFVRTVSRHGYRFVFADVVEEDDDGEWLVVPPPATTAAVSPPDTSDPYEPLLVRLTAVLTDEGDDEDQRDAAELLHALDTGEALRRLGTRPRHAFARALLRDTRWYAPHSGAVPILDQPAPFATARELIWMRLRRVGAVAGARLWGAAAGGGVAGAMTGAAGGWVLTVSPDSLAPLAVVPVLAAIGGGCGALGGAGVGAGLAAAEASFLSRRTMALVASAAAGGGIVGALAQWLGRWTLAAVVGMTIETGGSLEGIVIGAAAGLGYSIATSMSPGGLATPRGRQRLHAAAVTALTCGLAALALSIAGRPLVGGTIHAIATSSARAQATLTPIARLIGEPDFGPVTAGLIATVEGGVFGFGLALGMTRRRKRPAKAGRHDERAD